MILYTSSQPMHNSMQMI